MSDTDSNQPTEPQNQPEPKTRRSRRKATPDATEPAQEGGGTPEAAQQGEAEERTTWLARFATWTDNEAGVSLIHDRENRRLTIRFRDGKPLDAARALLRAEPHHFRYDAEDKVWYKAINNAKPGRSWAEAEQLAWEVANMIREEKGLPCKESFNLAR